jgi:ABC-2 type transport system ATP-binding protein
MPKHEIALEIADLSFRFGNKAALDDVSFSIGLGQFNVLLDPNGAGKGIGRINTLFSLFHQRKERDSRRRPDSGHTNSA